mgnify:CR=1 FL=1
MYYSLMVLDFDGTYNNPSESGGYGVEPAVYLIPENRKEEIGQIAEQAAEEFHTSDNGADCIGDIFERLMTTKGIFFQCIGLLKIPFDQRQEVYLSDSVLKVVI